MYIENHFIKLFHSYLLALRFLDTEQYSLLANQSKTNQKILNEYYREITNRSVAKSCYKNNPEVFKQVLPGTSNEPIRYSMKKDISDDLQAENKKGQKQTFTDRRAKRFQSLIELLYKSLKVQSKPSYLTKSVFYREKFKYLEMGGLQYANFKTQGNVSIEERDGKSYTPTGLIIYPTEANANNTMELKIPKKIGDAFKLSEASEFLMGTPGINNDVLIFFPLHGDRNKTNIQTVNADFLSGGPEEGTNFRSFRGDIYIYREPISIQFREIIKDKLDSKNDKVDSEAMSDISNIYRLKVPQAFLQTFESEASLLKKENRKIVKKPAFAFSFDMYGNLVYERVLFADKEQHEDYLLPGIMLQDLPSEVQNYDSITTNDLSYYQFINEEIED